MPYCPQCGQLHFLTRLHCEDCSHEQHRAETPFHDEDSGVVGAADEDSGQVAIARFQNGAEAGYFADELIRETGQEARVLTRERFDAVHAAWAVDYILLVDKAHVESATRRLQELVAATGDDDLEPQSMASEGANLPVGAWVPLILTLAAGSIACFGIERFEHRARPPALVVGDHREPPQLWEILNATRGAWVQKSEGSPGVRRLTLDSELHSARLQEDHDGDGKIDREWEFSWKKR